MPRTPYWKFTKNGQGTLLKIHKNGKDTLLQIHKKWLGHLIGNSQKNG
jgi:hypothetical protein